MDSIPGDETWLVLFLHHTPLENFGPRNLKKTARGHHAEYGWMVLLVTSATRTGIPADGDMMGFRALRA